MNIKRILLVWLLKHQFPELWQSRQPLAGIALMPVHQNQVEPEQPVGCLQCPDNKPKLSVLFLHDKALQQGWKPNEATGISQQGLTEWKRWSG